MFKPACSLFLVCILTVARGQSQELTRQAKIERILDLTNSAASVDRILDQTTASINSQMKSQMPKATPEELARIQEVQGRLMDLVKSRLSWTKMRAEYVRAFGEIFSDAINGMLAFYESPAGHGLLEKTPLVTQRILSTVQAQMGDLMPEIQRIVQESMQKKNSNGRGQATAATTLVV